MGLFDSGSKWNHDMKIDKKQHRRDVIGYRSSSRYNHENRKAAEDARVQARKDKRAENVSSSACLPIAVAMAGGLISAVAAAAYGVSKVVS